MFIDTHCHLDDPKLRDRLDEVVKSYLDAGVKYAIDIGCDAVTSEIVKEQAEKHESLYFAGGYHPMDVKNLKEGEFERIESLLSSDKCVAVGEIGLDYYWDKSNKDFQKECFIRQIDMAYRNKLPINVHVRDAIGDALEILKANRDKLYYGGVMHCFSGSIEMAKEFLKLGMHLSFGGTSTFKNARSVVEVLKYAPSDRILSETDCPFLAPEPLRGTVNEPKNIPIIVEKMSEYRNEDFERLQETIINNAFNLFKKLKK